MLLEILCAILRIVVWELCGDPTHNTSMISPSISHGITVLVVNLLFL